MKPCKDCKYCEWHPGDRRDNYLCVRPEQPIDPVTGRVGAPSPCWLERQDTNLCGPDGRWFEAGPDERRYKLVPTSSADALFRFRLEEVFGK